MRKKEKEIQDRAEIEAVIRKAEICRLGLSANDQPYVVPLNFGFDGKCLYFHTGQGGKKIDMIRRNHRVCFEVEVDCHLIRGETPCHWTMQYQSVIGYGTASLLTDEADKRHALDIIMRHYSERPGDYPRHLVDRLAVIRVEIETMTGRQSGFPSGSS